MYCYNVIVETSPRLLTRTVFSLYVDQLELFIVKLYYNIYYFLSLRPKQIAFTSIFIFIISPLNVESIMFQIRFQIIRQNT